MSVTDRPSLNGDASEPAPACGRTPDSAQRLSAPIRHCGNCLRHTTTDTVPAQHYQTITIPAYTVCGYCGHSYGFEDNA